MFSLFKKKDPAKHYDEAHTVPVIKSSICTGEQVAGFRDRTTGHIEEVMLIANDKDLKAFREKYGVEGEIEKVY